MPTLSYKTFADIASSQDSVLRREAAKVVTQILAGDFTEEMEMLFAEFRGPYVIAKQANNVEAKAKISRAWNQARNALGYHFRKAEYSATWSNLRSGDGDCKLIPKAEASQIEREKQAEKLEREQREAAAFKTKQALENMEATRALSLEEIAEQVKDLVSQSSHSLDTVIGHLLIATAPTPAAFTDSETDTERLAA